MDVQGVLDDQDRDRGQGIPDHREVSRAVEPLVPPQPLLLLAAVDVGAVVVLELPAAVAVVVVVLAGLYVPSPSRPTYDPYPPVFGPIWSQV